MEVTVNLSHSHTVNSHTHTTRDHVLTIDEIPAHKHELLLSGQEGSDPGPALVTTASNNNASMKISGYINNSGGDEGHNHGSTTASSPGTNSQLSASQSILNPYITVYMWKRIS